MTAKKKTKRSKSEYPGLDRNVNLRTRWDLIDHDYIDKLSDDEKAWLSKFNEEYISGTFTKKNGKYSGNLHKKVSQKREIWNRNNARNRCQQTLFGAIGMLDADKELNKHLEDASAESTASLEDNIIKLLDGESED